MIYYDLIGNLRSTVIAAPYSWKFVAGNNFMQNYEIAQQTFVAGTKVLCVDFSSSLTYSKAGLLNGVDYSGLMMLGIKFDATGGGIAQLDETYYQKYIARLKSLHETFAAFIGVFACNNKLTVQSCRFTDMINVFDDNVDFVKADIVYRMTP